MADLDDDIDLRPYVLALARRWWLILILGAVAGVAALAFSLSQPRTYEAIATLLLTRSRPTLSLAEQFPTVNEPIDTTSRMNAVLTLAQNDALAADTLKAIQEQLPEGERTVENIKNMIAVTNSGDAILIKVSAQNPKLSAKIANSWAERVVSAINQAYSGEQLPPEIENQIANAQEEYESAQSALESFVKDSQITLLEKQVEESTTLLDSLNKEQSNRISYFTERKQRMEEIIVQAEALKQQLDGGSGSTAASAGDALAVLLARAGSFNLPPTTSGLLIDMQLTDLDALGEGKNSYVRDLDRLIQQAEAEKTKAEESIQVILQEVVQSQQDRATADISANIQSLQSQLISQEASELELTSQRDLTWKAYQALAEKITEIRNAAPTTAEVSLVIPAIPPEKPSSRGTVRNTLVAVILGTGLAMLLILLIHWWQSTNQPAPENPSNPPGQ